MRPSPSRPTPGPCRAAQARMRGPGGRAAGPASDSHRKCGSFCSPLPFAEWTIRSGQGKRTDRTSSGEGGGVPIAFVALRGDTARMTSGRRRQNDPELPVALPAKDAASVIIGGEEFSASAGSPFVFGRADGAGVIGLDANDMGISAVAGSITSAFGVWWVVNESTKRPLLLEHPGGPAQLRLAPGHRHALTTGQMVVLVPGAIFTHVIEVVLGQAYVASLQGGQSRLTTGTLTAAALNLSVRERSALAALAAGYL